MLAKTLIGLALIALAVGFAADLLETDCGCPLTAVDVVRPAVLFTAAARRTGGLAIVDVSCNDLAEATLVPLRALLAFEPLSFDLSGLDFVVLAMRGAAPLSSGCALDFATFLVTEDPLALDCAEPFEGGLLFLA